jgi:Fe-Mn family superoxide dismutase
MKKFEEIKFNIGTLKGISAKNIEEHLKLYAGYVKNTNGIFDLFEKYNTDPVANSYAIGELHRRFSFEYNGMRNHEIYFSSLEGGPKPLATTSVLKKAIEVASGSFDNFLLVFKNLAVTTRGIGWAVLCYDKKDKRLFTYWIDEQHLGQLNGATPILMLDMWEHAYVYDYPTSEKKKYIEAFFENLNWKAIEENFKNVI